MSTLELLETRRLLAATDLDSTFGNAGKALLDHVTSSYDTTSVFALTPDNHLIVGGVSDVTAETKATLAKLGLDGSLDNTFGQGGKTRLSSGAGFVDMIANADNSVTTLNKSATGVPLMQRFTPAGTVDSTFNFTPTITGTPRGMAKTALGQFMATVSNNVVRISANGTADTTLGPGGVLAIPAEANSVQFIPHRVLPLSDGSFILGGTYGSVAQGTRRAAFRHYSSIGVLDTTFGTSGTLQINQLSTNTTIDKLVLVNGKAMAIVTDVNAQSSIVRFSTAGVLDSTFDGDGVVTVDPSGSFTEAMGDFVIDPSGNILGAGWVRGSTIDTLTVFIFRMNSSGALDTSFADSGFNSSIIATHELLDSTPKLQLTADGSLYLETALDPFFDTGLPDQVVFRFDSTTGAKDNNFAGNGRVTIGYRASVSNNTQSAALMQDGSVAFLGNWTGGLQKNQFIVGMLNSSGQPAVLAPSGTGTTEVDFGTYGAFAFGIAAQGDKLLVGGRTNYLNAAGTSVLNDYAIARLNSDGSYDNTFGTNGRTVVGYSGADVELIVRIAPAADGTIFAQGVTTSNAPSILHFDHNGNLDTDFAGTGQLLISSAAGPKPVNSIASLPDSSLLVAGYFLPSGASIGDACVIHVLEDGTIDSNFGTAGRIQFDFNNSDNTANLMTVDANGRIYVLSSLSGASIQIRRFSSAGQPDTTFGTSGVATFTGLTGLSAVTDMQLTASGKLLVYGTGGSPSDVVLLSYFIDGTADTSFGTSGKKTIDISGADSAKNLLVRPNGKWVLTSTSVGATTFNDFGAAQLVGETPDVSPPTLSGAFVSDPRPKLQINFSEHVLPPASGTVSFIAGSNGNIINVPQAWMSFDAANARLTITPDTSVADGNYSLHVAGGTATDLSGNTQSAAFDYDFFLLSADANHDRRVNALDFNALASNFGKPNPTFSKGDFNFDNKVDTSDFIALATKFGTFLAPPAAPPAAPFATASIAAGSATLFHHNERLVADPIVLLA